MDIRTFITGVLHDFNVTGDIVCHGRKNWQVVNAKGHFCNAALQYIRNELQFPEYLINMRKTNYDI